MATWCLIRQQFRAPRSLLKCSRSLAGHFLWEVLIPRKGEKTTGYGGHSSPIYTRGTGKTVCWFMFSKAAVVDEVRVTMIDEATDKVVAETRQPIQAKWANP